MKIEEGPAMCFLMRRGVVVGVTLLSFLSLSTSHAAADEPQLPSQVEEEARLLLRGALNARESVRTGRVRIRGDYTVRSLNELPSWGGPVAAFYTFDRERNLFRYDGEVPCSTHFNEPGDTSIAPPESPAPVHRVKFGFCRTSNYFAAWSQTGERFANDVNLYPLSREAEARAGGCGQRPLDVMAFGMPNYMSLQKGADLTRAYDIMLGLPVKSMSSDQESAIITVGRGDIVCEVELDQNLKAPVRLQHGPTDTPDRFRSEVEWRELSGVAVPVRYSARFTMPDVVEERLELELEWVEVNQDIPESEFEYTAFTGIPPERHDVYDLRSDPPQLLGRWIDEGTIRPPGGPQEPVTDQLKAKPGGSGIWKPLLLVNLCAGAVLLLVVWLRRRPRLGSRGTPRE